MSGIGSALVAALLSAGVALLAVRTLLPATPRAHRRAAGQGPVRRPWRLVDRHRVRGSCRRPPSASAGSRFPCRRAPVGRAGHRRPPAGGRRCPYDLAAAAAHPRRLGADGGGRARSAARWPASTTARRRPSPSCCGAGTGVLVGGALYLVIWFDHPRWLRLRRRALRPAGGRGGGGPVAFSAALGADAGQSGRRGVRDRAAGAAPTRSLPVFARRCWPGPTWPWPRSPRLDSRSLTG